MELSEARVAAQNSPLWQILTNHSTAPVVVHAHIGWDVTKITGGMLLLVMCSSHVVSVQGARAREQNCIFTGRKPCHTTSQVCMMCCRFFVVGEIVCKMQR